MDDLLLRLLVFAVVGIVSGYAAGLFSIGGGVIRIPIFVHLFPAFGLPHAMVMHVSVATSLALVLPSAMVSVYEHKAAGTLDLKYFWTWAIGLVIGVVAGAVMLPWLSTEILKLIFVIFLLVTATYLAFFDSSSAVKRPLPQGLVKVLAASGIGCLAQLTGTGGGVITTSTLKAFGISLNQVFAVAAMTTLVVGIVATAGGIISGWQVPGRPPYSVGYVDSVVWAAMTPTVLLFAPLGVWTGQKLSGRWLKRLLIALLIVIATEMAVKLFLEW